ncbi:ketopantoate reductase family protein [Clostridium sp. UBA1652]|uniref:ketopantoate reductase family protein n=1 Tax=Clostridium sp. UBA1652 TaxID=1946348 RepID=UPI00257D6B01|nr:2-dehydropantoate 2-reductase N-terminal domain-containing protein [Clostridium sp. UBA1652]
MKILIFGRGVISTQYAWALEKAGHTVEFYVRPGRKMQYGSKINLNIIDGRTKPRVNVNEKWSVTFIEDFSADHDYDLIILSLNHNQVSEAAKFLAPRIGKATVLVFNNFWEEPLKAIAPLPLNQIVWGFPGGGGGFYENNVLKGGFMKIIYLGHVDNHTNSERYKVVYSMFKSAGFNINEKKDLKSWLWFHFAMNTGMAAVALKVGGYSNLMDSPSYFKESVLVMREMLPLLKAKGDKTSLVSRIMLYLPAGLTGFVLQKATAKGTFARHIMDQAENSGHTAYDLTALYPRDVLAEARLLGVSMPKLESLEPYFK